MKKFIILFFVAMTVTSFSQWDVLEMVPNRKIHPKIPNDGSTDGDFSVMTVYNPANGRYYYFDPSQLGLTTDIQIDSISATIDLSTLEGKTDITNASLAELQDTVDSALLELKTLSDKVYSSFDILSGTANATAANLAATSTKKILVYNLDETDTLYVQYQNLSLGGIPLPPGKGWASDLPNSNLIWVYGSTTDVPYLVERRK